MKKYLCRKSEFVLFGSWREHVPSVIVSLYLFLAQAVLNNSLQKWPFPFDLSLHVCSSQADVVFGYTSVKTPQRKLLPFLPPITYFKHGRARVLLYLCFKVSGVLHALLQRPNIEACSSVGARHRQTNQTRPLYNKCCYFHFQTGNQLCGFSLARAF